MLDVARLSGVSYQTVSRVINNHPYVSDETRQRVQAAIDTLGYRPSKAATRLAAKSSKTIAIILYGGWFHGPVQIALNMEIAAQNSGLDVILINITEAQKQLTAALQHVNDWVVDGILLILPVQGLPFDEIQAICGTTPIIQIDSQRGLEIPSVVLDDYSGVVQSMNYLIEMGHTQFCEIAGPQNWFSAQTRHQACVDVLAERGLPPPPWVAANWSASGGYRAMKKLLDMGESFSAVVCANDHMALGALRALYEAGLHVPQDVSIVGFDDVPEAAYLIPPLTTVSQNYIQLGITAFEYLMQVMDAPETPLQQRVIMPKMLLRESVKSIVAVPPGTNAKH